MEAHDAAAQSRNDEPEPLHTEESDQGPPIASASGATHGDEQMPEDERHASELDGGIDAFMPSHCYTSEFFHDMGGNVSLSHYSRVHLLIGTHRKLHCTTRSHI
jgi:hypothetical protein